MSPEDPFSLRRFLEAQTHTFDLALKELRAGKKRTHWMWFIFPQLQGLGRTETARRFAISGLCEAEAFALHPVLGPRLREASEAALLSGAGLAELFGSPDDLKFVSSMTLFEQASPRGGPFGEALDRLAGGRRDEATFRGLARTRAPKRLDGGASSEENQET